MDAARVLVVVRRWWWLLATGAIVGIAAFGVSTRIRESSEHPAYAASGALVVHLDAAGGAVREQWELDRLIATYAEAAGSRAVAERVRDTLGLQNSIEDVRSRLHAEPVAGTSLLRVEARGAAPADAETLLNGLVRTLNGLAASDALDGSVSLYETDPATPVAGNDAPELLTALLVGTSGLLAACGVVFAFEHFSDAVRDASDVEDVTSLPVVGRVPHFRAGSGVAADASAASERFRALRGELATVEGAAGAKVLLVAGTAGGDGASTVAANYAATRALAGQRVVLVDADMRGGRLDAALGAQAHATLADLLADDILVDTAIAETSVRGLALVAAGRPQAHPADLLESSRAVRVFAVLREAFDVVVVDSPPALLTADALALATHADATLLVARQGGTARRDLRELLRRFGRMPARPVGVVLNDDLALASRRPSMAATRQAQPDAEVA